MESSGQGRRAQRGKGGEGDFRIFVSTNSELRVQGVCGREARASHRDGAPLSSHTKSVH